MARKSRAVADDPPSEDVNTSGDVDEAVDEELVLEGTSICALTGEAHKDTPDEQTLQSLIEQLLREYEVEPNDMGRDVRLSLEMEDPSSGKVRMQRKAASLVVYEHGKPHEPAHAIRVALVARAGTKPAAKKGIAELEEILAGINDRAEIFGIWTNGSEMAFRMRRFNKRTGLPEFTELTDFPAPDESLEDLETAERRPLRVASGDSLLRAFKRCHDYLYGNQNMRGDKAFWQLLHLIFAKILDEQQSRRAFFVGATEGNTPAGQKAVAARIKRLFEDAKTREYKDVFEGNEKIELNDRSLTYIASELGRYNLLSTDTDAKGTAYEAITSTTLKRERGQFFTPRNVIRMTVEIIDPRPGQKILDPACGSGGFLVVALAHVRRQLLVESDCQYPDVPVPSELKKIQHSLTRYAEKSLYGIDVDPDLRKAARMNMVMNNDGHGNIACFNSLEYGVPGRKSDAMVEFEKSGGGLGAFDFVLTNPPFGAKIPVDDPQVLSQFDLGHKWARTGDGWTRAALQRKAAPEILFIENCWRFLKPGTGVMGIVLPNGILGNPGEQMEAVRWWMLQQMELLASVDLPGDAFQPQVSVQASCVFLRRRDPSELKMAGAKGPKQRPVFMAIADECGHSSRGQTRYVRRADGTEETREETVTVRWEKGRKVESRERRRKMRIIADDMPWIASQYREYVAGKLKVP